MAIGSLWRSTRPSTLGALGVLCSAVVIVAGTGSASAAVPDLLSSSPAVGSVVDEVSQIELQFGQPMTIVPGSVKLASISGEVVATGEPTMSSASSVTIPVLGEPSGVQVLTWSAESVDDRDVGKGAITFEVGQGGGAVLDVGGATSAARVAEFSRVLVVVASLTVFASAVLLLIRGLRRRGSGESSRVVPVRAVVVAGGAALVVGGALGLVMTMRNVSITSSGSAISNALGTTFGTWSLVAILVGGIAIAAAVVRKPGVFDKAASGLVAVASLALVAGLVQAAPPAIPEGDFDQRVPVGDGLQLSVRVSPAAVGRNDFTIGIGGPSEAMTPATGEPPALSFRPLDGSIGAIQVPLVEQEDGGLVATSVLLPAAGRWRGELVGSTGLPADEGVFDFNVQPNPRLTDGSR